MRTVGVPPGTGLGALGTFLLTTTFTTQLELLVSHRSKDCHVENWSL